MSARMEQAIQDAIRSTIEAVIEEEAEKAGKAAEARVRAGMGGIVTRLASFTTFERFGDTLRIEVKFPNGKDQS